MPLKLQKMKYVESLNKALLELLQEDERVYLLGEDILDPYGGAFKVTKELSTAFPKRVLTTPISEAAIVGMAIGMAMRGLRPIVEIMFGDFLMLAADQIINSACKFAWMYNGQVEVPLVIRAPMGGYRGYGPTHSQTLETLFLNVPGLTIVAPSILHNPGETLKRIVTETTGPVLFIENKGLYAGELGVDSGWMVEDSDGVKTARLWSWKELPYVRIIAYGGMASLAIEASKELYLRDEILAEVVAPEQIKPLPQFPRSESPVVIVEETQSEFGWGAEVGLRLKPRLVSRVGAKSTPIPASRNLEQQTLPQVSDIVSAVKELI